MMKYNKASVGGDITELLKSWTDDRNVAIERLTPLVCDELHRIASRYMRGERPDHTLHATALVNEAYLRMIKQDEVSLNNRKHFFAWAAKIMRNILTDFARAHVAAKRGSRNKLQLDTGSGGLSLQKRSRVPFDPRCRQPAQEN